MYLVGWTAGIVDGEGHVKVEQKRGVVCIDNTDFRIIQKLKEGWGGSVFEYKRPDRPRSKRIWRWVITGKATVVFLKIIEPFLVSRKENARDVIDFYESK